MVGIVGGALAVGSAVGGGILSSNAASSAANAETGAANSALAYDENVYDKATSELQPYVTTGTNALYSLASLYGLNTGSNTSTNTANAEAAYKAYTETPAYQFEYQQGLNSMNRSAAASGLTLSGGQMAALDQYGSNYASTGFSNYVNQLASLANMGQSAVGTASNIGTTTANGVSSALNTAGTASAAGTVGSSNATTAALQSALPFLTGSSSSYTSGGGLLGSLSNLGGYTNSGWQ